MTKIHPSAVVEPGAELGSGVSIGPFTHISSRVILHDDVAVDSNVRIMNGVEIGRGTTIGASAVLGGAPQITPYKDEDTRIVVGMGCTIREHVTIHRGSTRGERLTTIGNNCYLMDSSHVGHDCEVGNDVILARGATLGGHSVLGQGVYVGGLTAGHQWTTIGPYAFIGGVVPLTRDVIPYAIVNGSPAKLEGLNLRGLKRRGLSRDKIYGMMKAFDLIFRSQSSTLKERLAEASGQFSDIAEVAEIIAFAQERADKGLCLAR